MYTSPTDRDDSRVISELSDCHAAGCRTEPIFQLIFSTRTPTQRFNVCSAASTQPPFAASRSWASLGPRPLNVIKIGGFPPGFGVAQQGSILVFVVLVIVYALRMDRLENDQEEL